MAPRTLRVVRGLSIATVATFVALVGHVTAGGVMPTAVGVLIPLGVAAAVSMLLVGTKRRFWSVAAAVVASQAAFHFLFVLGAPAQITEHFKQHGAHTALVALDVSTGSIEFSLMTWHHVLAAVVTTVVIVRGEAALLIVIGVAQRVVRRLVWLDAVPATFTVALKTVYTGSLVSQVSVHRYSGRSPPHVCGSSNDHSY